MDDDSRPDGHWVNWEDHQSAVGERLKEARREAVQIVEAWGEQRGVDVRELAFRVRTSPLKDGSG